MRYYLKLVKLEVDAVIMPPKRKEIPDPFKTGRVLFCRETKALA